MVADLQGRRYGWIVLVGCTALTMIATADDEDSLWMAVAAVAAGAVILAFPDGLSRLRLIRENPHVRRLAVLLAVAGVLTGLLNQPPEVLFGVLGLVVLGYSLWLAVPLRRHHD